MLFKKIAKFLYKIAEILTPFYRKLPIIPMLFKSRDEKRIFWIMNFEKQSRDKKRIFGINKWILKKSASLNEKQ